MTALGLALALAAQAVPGADPPRFAEETVVIAERAEGARDEMPASVAVVTRDEVQRLPAETLSGVLAQVPGVQVIFGEAYGLVPMVQARGFFGGGEAEYLQLIVDGVPVADVESGLADWRAIRAADLERIEVLRGPGSSLYGDTALGGVVQVFTRGGGAAPVREAGLSAGSFASLAGDGLWRGTLGGLRAGAHAAGARTDGFRAHSATGEGHADLTVTSAGAVPRLGLTLAGSSRTREDPGPLDRDQLAADRFASDPLFRFDREETRRGRAAITLRGGAAIRYRALLHGAARDTRFLRTLLLAAGFGDRALRDVDTRSAGLTLEGERAVASVLRLRAGADASRDHADVGYRAVSDDGTAGAALADVSVVRDRLGVFGAADWRARPRLRLAAGLRWDGIADDAGALLGGRVVRSAWSPRLGATVRLGGSDGAPLQAFVLASRAFKAPTLDQLVDPRPFPDLQGGTLTISNPRLAPQRAATLEAGLSRHGTRARWSIAAYRLAVEDEIDFDPATFRYANIGSSVHGGLEAEVRIAEGTRVSPRVSYAWTRVRLRDAEASGAQLKNIPEHVLRVGVTARLPGAVTAEVLGEALWRRFLDDANGFPMPDTLLVDARVQRTFRRLRARLDVTNLTGREWEAVGYVLPDFAGGLVPYVFPGAPRAVRAGLDVAF